jgi:hypothetical protein
MGCTESFPVASDLNHCHKVDPSVPGLGAKHGVPIGNSRVNVIVREKLFQWSGGSFALKHQDGTLFGNKLGIKGKVLTLRNEMVLQNGITNEPVAVCRRIFQVVGDTFKIYTTTPVYAGQPRSDQAYESRSLYTYASASREPFSSVQTVHLTKGGSYTVHRAGSLWPKKRVVLKDGIIAALMTGGTWDGDWNSYLIQVVPGIDPCLMVVMCAIFDAMDED